MKQFIDGITPTEQEVRQAVADLDVTRKNRTPRKNTTTPRTAQEESDLHLLRVIRSAFSELSIRGKGVCAEELVRELAKEKV